MYIHSFGRFVGHPVEDIKYYKQDVSQYTQLHFRRANRFVLLSLAGACRCVHGRGIEKDTGVYLTTENGNLGDTEAVLDQIFHQHQFPMPYNFINTMSNTASFYVAQSLGLFGRNLTLSSKQFSFERGLELLRSDQLCGAVKEALIGGVDEAYFSGQQFASKFERNADTIDMIEGSCWLLIKDREEGALGRVTAIETFGNMSQVLSWMKARTFQGPVQAGFGLLLTAPEKQAVIVALSNSSPFDYIADYGYYDSATACGVTAFLERYQGNCLVHVNKDFLGQFVVLVIEQR